MAIPLSRARIGDEGPATATKRTKMKRRGLVAEPGGRAKTMAPANGKHQPKPKGKGRPPAKLDRKGLTAFLKETGFQAPDLDGKDKDQLAKEAVEHLDKMDKGHLTSLAEQLDFRDN